MPSQVVDLPNLVTSAAGTNSSVITSLDDASSITIVMTTTTTSGANGAQVQIEVTATGTNFATLSSSPQTVTSSQSITIPNISFRQLRMAATGAMANGLTFNAVKQISV